MSFVRFRLFLNILVFVGFDAPSFCSRFQQIWKNSCITGKFSRIDFILCLGEDIFSSVSSALLSSPPRRKVPKRSHFKEKSHLSATALSKPSECYHATFHCRLWSSYWFWLCFSCACCAIFICGLPATRGTARSIRPNNHKANKIYRRRGKQVFMRPLTGKSLKCKTTERKNRLAILTSSGLSKNTSSALTCCMFSTFLFKKRELPEKSRNKI